MPRTDARRRRRHREIPHSMRRMHGRGLLVGQWEPPGAIRSGIRRNITEVFIRMPAIGVVDVERIWGDIDRFHTRFALTGVQRFGAHLVRSVVIEGRNEYI